MILIGHPEMKVMEQQSELCTRLHGYPIYLLAARLAKQTVFKQKPHFLKEVFTTVHFLILATNYTNYTNLREFCNGQRLLKIVISANFCLFSCQFAQIRC